MNSPYTSRAIIDLSAYEENLHFVRQRIPRECGIMAVVKTNAYGLGLIPIASRAVSAGVEMLAVATVDEGVALREAGITAPILVFVPPTSEALPAVIEHELRVMMSTVELTERLGDLARRANKVVPVHCKVDTGMSRMGFAIDEALDALRYMTHISHIDIEGIATHFAEAEEPDNSFTSRQIWAFKQLLKKTDKAGTPYEMAHAANSAAIINYPDSAFDMVRPGLMTYGVWPTVMPPSPLPLRPVLSVGKPYCARQGTGAGRQRRLQADLHRPAEDARRGHSRRLRRRLPVFAGEPCAGSDSRKALRRARQCFHGSHRGRRDRAARCRRRRHGYPHRGRWR